MGVVIGDDGETAMMTTFALDFDRVGVNCIASGVVWPAIRAGELGVVCHRRDGWFIQPTDLTVIG